MDSSDPRRPYNSTAPGEYNTYLTGKRNRNVDKMNRYKTTYIPL